MTFLAFCFLITGLFVLALIITIIVLAKVKVDADLWAIPSGTATLVFGVAGIISWISFGYSINDQHVDQKYCEGVAARDHQTQFFVYNLFNHECYILVDNQWMEIKNSPFDKGIK